MDRLMSGVGDGCDSCLIPRSLWTDQDTIEEGFPRDRTLESNRATWSSLRKRRDGEVFKVTGDYETRQGLCHEPKALRDQTSFTVTHKVSSDNMIRKLGTFSKYLLIFKLSISWFGIFWNISPRKWLILK